MNLTRQVIGCAIAVHRELGNGYVELVYERALEFELSEAGLQFERQVSLPVEYKGKQIGRFTADVLVEKCLILELKAQQVLTHRDTAQLINYLKASKISVGLLINFGNTTLKAKRLVHNFNEDLPI